MSLRGENIQTVKEKVREKKGNDTIERKWKGIRYLLYVTGGIFSRMRDKAFCPKYLLLQSWIQYPTIYQLPTYAVQSTSITRQQDDSRDCLPGPVSEEAIRVGHEDGKEGGEGPDHESGQKVREKGRQVREWVGRPCRVQRQLPAAQDFKLDVKKMTRCRFRGQVSPGYEIFLLESSTNIYSQ